MSNEEIIQEIQQDPNRVFKADSIPCIFYGERVVKKVTYSASIGYSLVQDYEWTEAYNNSGILGGFSLTNIIDSIVEGAV